VIIGETSSIRLRPLTTGIGRGCYYLVNIPCIFLASYMLNAEVSFPCSPRLLCPQIADKILHTGWKPRRKMRLCLGRHGILLLGPGLPLRPRDEGPLLPRDRHPVQPPRAGSQVEGYRHRRPGRRVRSFWNELAAAAVEVVNICCGRVERMSDRVQLRRSARTLLQSHTLKETFRCAPSPDIY
jgi:hypothetical protein